MILSVKTGEQEVEAVKSAVQSFALPKGINDVIIRQGQDEDGDPIVWVLFAVDEPQRGDMGWVRDYTPFLKSVRQKLYDILHEHRPVVGLT